MYQKELGHWLSFQKVPSYVDRATFMIFMVLAKDKAQRDAYNSYLNAHGVDTRIPWPPVHRQPYFVKRFGEHPCPVADHTFDRALSLPIGNAMTEDDVHYVVQVSKAFFEGRLDVAAIPSGASLPASPQKK